MEHLFDAVLNPLATSFIEVLVVVLIGFIINFVRKKTGIKISEALQKKAETAAVQAVLAVEETAASKLKDKSETWLSKRKHGEAFKRIINVVPEISKEQADELVHWAVAKIPGLGATKDFGAQT